MSELPAFDRQRHIGYFSYCLRKLPQAYSKLDTNRLTLVHFGIQALNLLDAVDTVSKESIVEWIYSLQVTTNYVGFTGGSFLGGSDPTDQPWEYNHGHIAMTYTALCTLKALGDDLSRVDKKGIIQALSTLQLSDGSFACIHVGSEHDMRFLYCACCISHMLNDWSGVNSDKAVKYIRQCRSFDGAIALLPGQEGHGGSTFCAVASLVLMQKLDDVIDTEWRKELVQWCVSRQVNGMQGRPNKAEDTCYSYWIGGTLRLLGEDDLLNHEDLRGFVLQCQTKMGGFSKVIGAYPDMLHAYYSLAYLSLSQPYFEESDIQLKELNCTLGVGKDVAAAFQPLFP